MKNKFYYNIHNIIDEATVILENAQNNDITPKQELDNFIKYTTSQGIDFWSIVEQSRNKRKVNDLKWIFEGKDLLERYESPDR